MKRNHSDPVLILVQLHLCYDGHWAFYQQCSKIFHKWLWAFLYSSCAWSEQGNVACPGLGSSQWQGDSHAPVSRHRSPAGSPRGATVVSGRAEMPAFCWLLYYFHRLLASGWAAYFFNAGIPCFWLRQHGFGGVRGGGSLTVTLHYLYYPASF